MATEPTPWDTAGSGYSIAANLQDGPRVSYANGDWYSVSGFGGTVINVRQSASARGPWTTVQTLGTPTGFSNHYPISALHYMGGTYGYFAWYQNFARFPNTNSVRYWFNYTTDPNGSWSQYELPYASYAFLEAGTVNSEWYLSGYEMTTSVNGRWQSVIAHSSSGISGWTAELGGTAGMNTTTQYRVFEVLYDDAQAKYLRRALYGSYNPTNGGTVTPYRIQSATSLSGTWTTHYEGPDTSTPLGVLQQHSNGVWTIPEFNSSYPDLLYSTDPTTTSWSRTNLTFASSDLVRTAGMLNTVHRTLRASFGSGFWLVTFINTAKNASKIAFVKAANPTGTFTDAVTTIGSTSGASNVITDLAVDDSKTDWVAAVNNTSSGGSARLYSLTSSLVVLLRSFLRLRQSPVRTPSRVRSTDLRQRQTPYIT